MNYPTNLPIKPEVTLCCHSDQVARLTMHYDVTDWMKNGVKTKKVAFSSSPINRISNESDFGFRRIPKSKIQFNHFRKLLQFKYYYTIQIQHYFILYGPCHVTTSRSTLFLHLRRAPTFEDCRPNGNSITNIRNCQYNHTTHITMSQTSLSLTIFWHCCLTVL